MGPEPHGTAPGLKYKHALLDQTITRGGKVRAAAQNS